MYVNCRVVPWLSDFQFRYVLSKIKSSDINDTREAALWLQIWLCRVNVSKIPRAIVCTYELLLARVQQSTQAMALAVMRFISLVSSEDQDRNRGGFAVPIYSLSRSAGLPDWMGDLRNDIAHGSVPSRQFLEVAYAWAMRWLVEFWERNTDETLPKHDFGNPSSVKWNSDAVSIVDDSLKDSIRHYSVTHAFAEHLVDQASKCFHKSVPNYLKSIFRSFQKFRKLNNLVLAVFFNLPKEGAIFWANAWIGAYKAVSLKEEHFLKEFVDENDLASFPWRHCLEQVCLKCNPSSSLLVSLLELFQPHMPDKLLSTVIGICHSDCSLPHNTSDITRSDLKWQLDRTVRWWRIPLGASLTKKNASTSCQDQGFPHEDPPVGCQIGQDKDQQRQCEIQDTLQPVPLHAGGYRKGKG
uniref:DUF4209 domain-containing protein n=1 Tax=Mesocestoides corti TaxID=53468 RepID=A0A5K3EEE5_MESCO